MNTATVDTEEAGAPVIETARSRMLAETPPGRSASMVIPWVARDTQKQRR